jgi:hypothetical protein
LFPAFRGRGLMGRLLQRCYPTCSRPIPSTRSSRRPAWPIMPR